MKTCKYCGQENEDHAVFCPGCGTSEFKRRKTPGSGPSAADLDETEDPAADALYPALAEPPSIVYRMDEKDPGLLVAEGRCRKQVRCESCGHEYTYKMKRVATNRLSGFISGQAEARAEAIPLAQERVQVMLAEEFDSKPCPKCGALTSQMKARGRKARFFLIGMGLVLVLVGGFMLVAMVSKLASEGRWHVKGTFLGFVRGFVMLVVGIIALAGGLGLFPDRDQDQDEWEDDRG